MTDNILAMVVLAGLVIFFMLLPAKYDPAIRLKEYNERKKK